MAKTADLAQSGGGGWNVHAGLSIEVRQTGAKVAGSRVS